ncbi:uncharacterized protein LOC129747446 [Uranotaenia lowii]|uniref:uncharacterized protein LOC129747446 n=1 Tax=Uranotaenia lowii TaxID=190385 RepID=UPI00247B0C33|nr:uncharacterized protein LOC129747446 [Uranotaenia lowii]
MYEIISCAKDSQLHSFPAFESLCSSGHVNEDGSDLQFFTDRRMFARVNKNWGIEMMRIKTVEGKPVFANVKKILTDNLYCVACPKADREEIAVGLTSGGIRLMGYKKASSAKRLEADRINNGVTFMDFNATDELLAAVYENGSVNVYGMKTSSRLYNLAFDKNTTKARFHPAKRFLLSVASYNGSVLMYDTHQKKVLFNQVEAHTAPCRDLAMTAASPDMLYTVGYDNVINVFDTRKKQAPLQIRSNYPFESLAVSECGQFLCVGNLKGYLYGYDARNLSKPLNTNKCHDSSVTSILFANSRDGETVNTTVAGKSVKKVSIVEEPKICHSSVSVSSVDEEHPVVGKPEHDSFMNEIDMFLQRRDSMDCMSRLSTSSRMSSGSARASMGGGNNLMSYLDDIDDNFDSEQNAEDTQSPNLDESYINTNRLVKRNATKKQPSLERPQKSSTNLENIREESDVDSSRALSEIPPEFNGDQSKQGSAIPPSKRVSLRRSTNAENKENQFSPVPDRTSTPQSTQESTPVIPQHRDSTKLSTGDSLPPTVQAAFQELKLEMADLRNEMRAELKEHFFQNNVDRKYTAMATRSHLWMGTFNLWQETQQKLERIDEVTQAGFGLLLSNDEFTQRYMALQKENEQLKRRISELEKEKSGSKK